MTATAEEFKDEFLKRWNHRPYPEPGPKARRVFQAVYDALTGGRRGPGLGVGLKNIDYAVQAIEIALRVEGELSTKDSRKK